MEIGWELCYCNCIECQAKEAENSTNIITNSNEEMSAQICRLDEIAKQLLDEESKGAEKLVALVGQVKDLAEQLANE